MPSCLLYCLLTYKGYSSKITVVIVQVVSKACRIVGLLLGNNGVISYYEMQLYSHPV